MNTANAAASVPGRPAADTRPRWLRPFDIARVVVNLLLTLVVSVSLDLWTRFMVLPFQRTPEQRIAAINRLAHLWGRVSFWLSRTFLGLRVTVEGQAPASGRCFILSNHQSSLDIALLISIFKAQNLKFVAMEELKHGKPLVSLALRNGGFAIVAKRDRDADLAHLDDFGRNLERFDGSPIIFPEGQRTLDGEVLPFHLAGTEVIRRRACLPMVAVTIDGLWRARTIKEFDRIIGSHVTVRIGESIPNDEIEKAPRETYARIEHRIRNDIEDIRGRLSDTERNA